MSQPRTQKGKPLKGITGLRWINQQWQFVQGLDTPDCTLPYRQERRQTSRTKSYQSSPLRQNLLQPSPNESYLSCNSQLSAQECINISSHHNSEYIKRLNEATQELNVVQEVTNSPIDNYANNIIENVAFRETHKQGIRQLVVGHLKREKQKIKKGFAGDIAEEVEQMQMKNHQPDLTTAFQVKQQQFMRQNLVEQLIIASPSQKKQDSLTLEQRTYQPSKIPLPVLFSQQISYKKSFNFAYYPPVEKGTYSLNYSARLAPVSNHGAFKVNHSPGNHETMNETQISTIIREVDKGDTHQQTTHTSKFVSMAQEYLSRSNDKGKDKIAKVLNPLFQSYNYQKKHSKLN